MEIRDVPGWPGYRVDDNGVVYGRYRGGAPLKAGLAGPKPYQYWQVTLRAKDRGRQAKVHHLVLEAFVGPRPEGMVACHGNDDRNDNRLSNLRWDYPRANYADAMRNGRTATGTRVGSAKLNPEIVRTIRRRVAAGERQRVVAESYGLKQGYVSHIVNGQRWRHVGT